MGRSVLKCDESKRILRNLKKWEEVLEMWLSWRIRKKIGKKYEEVKETPRKVKNLNESEEIWGM